MNVQYERVSSMNVQYERVSSMNVQSKIKNIGPIPLLPYSAGEEGNSCPNEPLLALLAVCIFDHKEI